MTEISNRAAPVPIKTVPARSPGQWIFAAAALAALAYVVKAFVTTPNISWSTVADYLTYSRILDGVLLTILLTVVAQAIGIVGGVLLAVMRLSRNPVLNAVSWFYIWFFRGTPVLIQIIFWFNLALIFPTMGIGIPFTNIGVSAPTNSLISAFVAAILALGLNEAAYMAEIVRGGIFAVDQGQSEAAASIGMSRARTMRYIVLPQAIRVIIPPTGNELIGMLKSTSLVSVIGTRELLTSAQQIYAANFMTVELLIVASFWYLVMTTIATFLQGLVERRYENSLRARPETLTRRLSQYLGARLRTASSRRGTP